MQNRLCNGITAIGDVRGVADQRLKGCAGEQHHQPTSEHTTSDLQRTVPTGATASLAHGGSSFTLLRWAGTREFQPEASLSCVHAITSAY